MAMHDIAREGGDGASDIEDVDVPRRRDAVDAEAATLAGRSRIHNIDVLTCRT